MSFGVVLSVAESQLVVAERRGGRVLQFGGRIARKKMDVQHRPVGAAVQDGYQWTLRIGMPLGNGRRMARAGRGGYLWVSFSVP